MPQHLAALGFSGLSGMKGNVMKHPLALALTLTSTLAFAQASSSNGSSLPGTFSASGADTSVTAPSGSNTVLPSDRSTSNTATMGGPSSDASAISSSPRRKAVRGSGRMTQDDSWSTLYPGKQ
jgi:hypothetical protein